MVCATRLAARLAAPDVFGTHRGRWGAFPDLKLLIRRKTGVFVHVASWIAHSIGLDYASYWFDTAQSAGDVPRDTGDALDSNTALEPPASPEPTTPPEPPASKMLYDPTIKHRQIEDMIFEQTNNRRDLYGVEPLERDPALDAIALSHSQDMAERGYYSHNTPEGLDPTDRGNAAGYPCRKDFGSYYTYGLGENLFKHSRGLGVEQMVNELMIGWMESVGHRGNIVDPSYDYIGVGVAVSTDWYLYATQNFC